MEWNDVRVFLAVARGAGLSGAARLLHLSVQTVGRRVAALEDALGARCLFGVPPVFVDGRWPRSAH